MIGVTSMSAVALYTPDAYPELTQLLDLGGHIWKRIVTENDVVDLEPDEGWAGAIIQLGEDPERGMDHYSGASQKRCSYRTSNASY